MPAVDADAIPTALKDRDQWICWRTVCRNDDCGQRLDPTTKECPDCGEKATKRPINPHGGGFARSNDPTTWASLATAQDYHDRNDVDGLGFMFDPEGLVAGVDLDDCRDPETGDVAPWASEIMDELNSYTEVSPSGTGLHVYVLGFLPNGRNKREVEDGEIEMYDGKSRRYFTVTGEHLGETPATVEQRNESLQTVHDEYLADDDGDDDSDGAEPADFDAPEPSGRMEFENEFGTPLSTIRERDDKLNALLSDLEPAYSLPKDDNSPSGYDMAAASKLWFWRFDRQQIARILRTYRARDKLNRDDYLTRTIRNATGGERCDPPKASDGGIEAEPGRSDSEDPSRNSPEASWQYVAQQFESDANGSTTDACKVATDLLDDSHNFAVVRESEAVYWYDPETGFYKRKGKTYIRELLEERIPGHTNPNRVRTIRDKLIARNYVDADEFTPPEGKICLKNGVLDLESRTLKDHSPGYCFTAALPVEYDETASWDVGRKFLKDSVGSTEEYRTIQEFVGYCLEVWHHKRAKNLFIVGPTQSGKSTFAQTVQSLFGEAPSVSQLTPQQLADTQFDASALIEAILNIRNDINATKIEDSGTLKTIFAGERIKMERKYEHPMFRAPTAKHLFTANWLPRIVGEDEAFFRRVLIVEFPDTVPENERDLELGEKLRKNKPGMLNWALDGRDRLHERGRFSLPDDLKDTRRKWRSWRSSTLRFLYEQFEITGADDDTVERDTFYRAYKEWAGRTGYEIKPKQSVTKTLGYVPYVETDSEQGLYRGLKFKEIDAADPADTKQTGLPDKDTQDKRIHNILSWVDEFSTPVDAAARDDVLDHAELQGYDRDTVAETIESLLENGELTDTGVGIRRT